MTDTTQQTFAGKLESLCKAFGPFGTVKYGVTKSGTSKDDVLVPFIEVQGVRAQMTAEEAKQAPQKVSINFFNRPGTISEHARLEFYPKGKGWRVDRYEGKSIGVFTGDTGANGTVRRKTDEEIRARFGKKTGTLGQPGAWEEELPNSWFMQQFSIEKAPPVIDNAVVTKAASLGAKKVSFEPSRVEAQRF